MNVTVYRKEEIWKRLFLNTEKWLKNIVNL